MPVHSVAVFCGSKNGSEPVFAEHTARLGKLLADAGIRIVYGGGNVGLMGLIADSAMASGGEVTGVIPEVLLAWERQHQGLTEMFVVPDMHNRKRMMYELSDAAIILPGGFGTLDELFEMITWNNLSIHDKHIYILNSGGFYEHLLAHVSRMQETGFLYESWNRRLTIAPDPESIVELLLADKL